MENFLRKIVSGLVLLSLASCGGSASRSDKVSKAKTLNGIFVSEKKQSKSVRKIPVENSQFITFKQIQKERLEAEKEQMPDPSLTENADEDAKPVFQDWFFPNFGSLLNTEKPSDTKHKLDQPFNTEIKEVKESEESKIEVLSNIVGNVDDHHAADNVKEHIAEIKEVKEVKEVRKEETPKKESFFHNLFPASLSKLINREKSPATAQKENYPDLHDVPHAPAEFTNPELLKNQAKEDIDSIKKDVKEHQEVINTIKEETKEEPKKEEKKSPKLPIEIIKQNDESKQLHVPTEVNHNTKPLPANLAPQEEQPAKSKAEEFEKQMKQPNVTTTSKKYLVKDVSRFYKKKEKPFLEPATQNRYKTVYQN